MGTLVIELMDMTTGFHDVIEQEWFGSNEGAEFYWTEGNMACDCNRAQVLLSVDRLCGNDMFKLLSLSLDGEDLVVDSHVVDYDKEVGLK